MVTEDSMSKGPSSEPCGLIDLAVYCRDLTNAENVFHGAYNKVVMIEGKTVEDLVRATDSVTSTKQIKVLFKSSLDKRKFEIRYSEPKSRIRLAKAIVDALKDYYSSDEEYVKRISNEHSDYHSQLLR